MPILQRLAHDFQGLPAELWQLVKEKDTVVGQRNLARTGVGATAQKTGVGYGMVR